VAHDPFVVPVGPIVEEGGDLDPLDVTKLVRFFPRLTLADCGPIPDNEVPDSKPTPDDGR
jgi:hypothetical protein